MKSPASFEPASTSDPFCPGKETPTENPPLRAIGKLPGQLPAGGELSRIFLNLSVARFLASLEMAGWKGFSEACLEDPV